jgi:hypothetical protein
MAEIVIREPYSGVPGLALGGYVAGLLGHPHSGAVEVTLRRPVSIGDTLSVDDADESVQLSRDGEVVAAQIGYVSVTFDHRVVDGARAAEFGLAVIRRLEG